MTEGGAQTPVSPKITHIHAWRPLFRPSMPLSSDRTLLKIDASSTAAKPSRPAVAAKELAACSAMCSTSEANSAWRSPKSPFYSPRPCRGRILGEWGYRSSLTYRLVDLDDLLTHRDELLAVG